MIDCLDDMRAVLAELGAAGVAVQSVTADGRVTGSLVTTAQGKATLSAPADLTNHPTVVAVLGAHAKIARPVDPIAALARAVVALAAAKAPDPADLQAIARLA